MKPGNEPAAQLVALSFPGTSGNIVLTADTALIDGLSACVAGWQPALRRLRRPPRGALAGVARTGAGHYRLRSRFLDRPTGDLPLASAVCGLLADLSQDWAETQPQMIGLHCGAVRIGGRLLLLTGAARAGKSTLVTRLAAEPGVALFCDDVLPVTPAAEGVALGIAPRLRLPAPAGSATLGRLAAESVFLADDRYGYVAVPDQAPHGTRAPLGAILLLDRREGAPATLHAVDPAEVLSTLLRQSITGYASAEAAFERARALALDRPCLRLVYSDLDEAAAVILRTFATGARPRAGFTPAPACDPPPDAMPAAPVPTLAVLQRNPEVRLRCHGRAAYLWQPDDAMLWELNPLGLAIWEMLALPGSAQDMADALAEVFPMIPPDCMAADAAQLLGTLQAAGLVRAAGG